MGVFMGYVSFREGKWLGSPPFISHLGQLEGEQPYLKDLLTMVINHLLTGMILQVRGVSLVVNVM